MPQIHGRRPHRRWSPGLLENGGRPAGLKRINLARAAAGAPAYILRNRKRARKNLAGRPQAPGPRPRRADDGAARVVPRRTGREDMAISRKASKRKTSPAREAAGQQTASRRERQKAGDKAARETQSGRRSAKTGSRAIQAHVQARGQRGQAKRDSVERTTPRAAGTPGGRTRRKPMRRGHDRREACDDARGDNPIAPDYYDGLTRLRSFALACSRESPGGGDRRIALVIAAIYAWPPAARGAGKETPDMDVFHGNWRRRKHPGQSSPSRPPRMR